MNIKCICTIVIYFIVLKLSNEYQCSDYLLLITKHVLLFCVANNNWTLFKGDGITNVYMSLRHISIVRNNFWYELSVQNLKNEMVSLILKFPKSSNSVYI